MTRTTVAALVAAFLAVAVVWTAGTPAAEAARKGNAPKCGGGKIFLKAGEKKTFDHHNKFRKRNGLKPLCVHPALQRAARAHSRDMIRRGYFSHGDVGARLKRHGYNWRTYGENIYYGGGARAAMKAWKKSRPHRANILGRKFREVGVGTHRGVYKGQRVNMYTVDFGTRR